MKDNIRHSMWSICLDVDFKCDFVIIDEASLWISHILKHISGETVHIYKKLIWIFTFNYKKKPRMDKFSSEGRDGSGSALFHQPNPHKSTFDRLVYVL